ncbi:MAG TPA: DUF1080 domain-containing protein [Tepidisphaeraceae bacterium]|jgi:hypothetical protein|nr:DUF1080 domain-containing protein [Tepidisphaeraceae bacterium]
MLKLRAALIGLALLPLASLSPAADEKPAAPAAAKASEKAPEITPATADDAKNFFNGKDLTGFWGDVSLWHVENGELVGKTSTGIKKNEFLKTTHSYGDFRLICKMKLVPNGANSGIQFHSVQHEGNEMAGPQADSGAGWWGSLYGENFHNKTLCPNKAGEANSVNKEDWNLYEIVAVGTKVRTAMNGHLCVDIDLPDMPTTGMFGLQIHAGGPTEVRFKDFQVELNPKFELTTVKK